MAIWYGGCPEELVISVLERLQPRSLGGMTTPNEHLDPSAQTEAAGMNLQSDEAKATAVGITADNAALEEAYQSAEAQADATTEQAHQMAQATEEVLEELQEMKEAAKQA